MLPMPTGKAATPVRRGTGDSAPCEIRTRSPGNTKTARAAEAMAGKLHAGFPDGPPENAATCDP
jgi:hypothetical protein